MRWLARRDLTEAELRARLERAATPTEVTEAVLAHARARKWVDDERVATRTTEIAAQHKALGTAGIDHVLERKGVDETLRDAVLENDEEQPRATSLAAKERDRGRTAAQTARKLAAKGYSEESIRGALDAIYPGWEEPVPLETDGDA